MSEEVGEYIKVINNYSKRSDVLHIEPAGDKKTVKLSYYILLKKDYYSCIQCHIILEKNYTFQTTQKYI